MTRAYLLLLTLLWLLAGAASALTADELIAKDLQARGGLDKLKAIQSLRLTGKLRYGGSTELGYRSLVRRPGMLREEATLQGMTAITVSDGQSAWQMTPFGGRRDPERLSSERLQELQDDADLDGPLVDYQLKGHQVLYLGLNRVYWSMRVAPAHVPRAAQLAGASTQGPRVVPGSYKVRLTKGDKVYETTLQVGPDRRSGFTADERQAEFEAAMRVHRLFGSMASLVDRLEATKMLAQAVKPQDAALAGFAARVEECRKKVVATKEGGAITGEERLREHADELYDALLSYEGRPAAYLVDRIGVLERELADVRQDFEGLLKSDLPGLNQELKGKGLPPLEPPPLNARNVNIGTKQF